MQHIDGPVGTLHWWNLTGSTDENPNEAGFAHFLEHMLFKDAAAKDSGTPSTGQMARAIESLGGEINAYTTFDQTVYHVTCSEQYFEKTIDQFCMMAKPQRFLKTDFEREREVIIEELRRGQDSPDRMLFEKLFALSYAHHPYRRPIIGYEKVLKAATVKTLESFYRRRYVSGQMGIILVGPIEGDNGARKKKIISILEKRFGKKTIPTKSVPKRVRKFDQTVQKKAKFVACHFDVKTSTMAISYRIPELANYDIAQLEILSGILGMGETSRLYQKLFYEKALVTDIGISVYVPRDPGLFFITAELKNTSDADEVSKIICDEILDIVKNGVTKEEIDRIVLNLESDKYYSTQTAEGVAGRLGFLRFSLGDLNYGHEYIEKIKSTTPRTIQHLAKKYLIPGRMSMVILQPKEEELYGFKNIEKIFDQLKPIETEQKRKQTKYTKSILSPTVFTTKNGLKVSYFERANTQVFSVYFSSLGGTRFEFAENNGDQLWGKSHLLGQTWDKGTKTLSSKQINKIIEGSAASLDGFSGRNTIGLQMSGLIRDWEKLSPLFEDVLLNPTFSEEELAHSKRVTTEQIKSIPDHSSQVCSKLFLENLFLVHPYGKHHLSTIEHVENTTSNHLQDLHRKWVRNDNSVLSIVSGFPLEDVQQWIDELDQKIADRSTDQFKIPLFQPESKIVAPRWAYANFDREQTHIMIGGLGISLYDHDRYALRLLQNILGGQSGRLFIELREKKSMAYTVAPMMMEGLETGYVGTYIACAPQKKNEAIAGMNSVIETLVKKGPTSSEMTRAKNYYLGQRAMDLQSTWSLAASFGLELLYRNSVISETTLRSEIAKVTSQQIQKVGEKLFIKANKVTVTIG